MQLLQLLFNLSPYWCRSALHSRRWRKRRLTDFLLSNFSLTTREFLFKSLKDNFMLLVIFVVPIHVIHSIGGLAQSTQKNGQTSIIGKLISVTKYDACLVVSSPSSPGLCWVERVYVQRWWLPNENTCRLRHVVFKTSLFTKA